MYNWNSEYVTLVVIMVVISNEIAILRVPLSLGENW